MIINKDYATSFAISLEDLKRANEAGERYRALKELCEISNTEMPEISLPTDIYPNPFCC